MTWRPSVARRVALGESLAVRAGRLESARAVGRLRDEAALVFLPIRVLADRVPPNDSRRPMHCARSLGAASRPLLPTLTVLTLLAVGCERGGARTDLAGGSASARVGPAGSAPERRPAPRSVRLRPRLYAVGHRERVESTQALQLAVEFWEDGVRADAREQRRAETQVRSVEVLALVGRRPGKIRVSYDRYSVDARSWEGPLQQDQPLEGRSYVLDATGPRALVTGASGRALEPAERDLVRAHHASLGKEDPIVQALGLDPIAVGSEHRMSRELFAALMAGARGDLKKGRYTLRGLRQHQGHEVAVIEWATTFQTKELGGSMVITWEVRGEALVGLDPAVTLRNEAKARLSVSGNHRQGPRRFELEGAGSMEHVVATRWLSESAAGTEDASARALGGEQ